MSTLFPEYVPRKGHAIRIYYSRPWKNAYVYVVNGLVTHASPELVFTLGWTREKVIARAEKVGFSYTRIDAMKPKDTWLTARPAPVQESLPLAPTLPPNVRPYIDPAAVRKAVESRIEAKMPQRDAFGRFISKNPTKSKKKGKA